MHKFIFVIFKQSYNVPYILLDKLCNTPLYSALHCYIEYLPVQGISSYLWHLKTVPQFTFMFVLQNPLQGTFIFVVL